MLFGVSGRNGPVQPVLAVGDAGDDVAHHIVSGGVDHCGRGIYQVADGHQDGEGTSICWGKKMEQMMYSPM